MKVKDMSSRELVRFIMHDAITDAEAWRTLEGWLIVNDFVKIVRCGDCQFECDGQCNKSDNIVSPLGHCAWGEKK